ncbi:hypothetical protein [Pseudomonas sp. HS6]|uniref:hypothetical protein n=1 Tax=Pseudomonas sp. HS6 TaxID=2850559 RepID=UPI0020194D4F|nr:hypothetical protein [Pseudomonas sp. HS6]UQS13312.1 hypothetical protein JJN09_19040 [Pseudomonas sp. HS6]
MYWIEICNDGSYVSEGVEYSLQANDIEIHGSYDGARSGDDWAKSIIPFGIATPHGDFTWEVEIIEYLKKGVTSFIGYALTAYPDGVLLKEEVMFRIQDGWAYPNETDPQRPSASKMRLV